jgi:hypothetical protein
MDSYEEVPMIKTFRGQIADGAQDTIVLHTNDGSTGYRIVKFSMMTPDPSENAESVIKIYKVSQTAVDAVIDFNDQTLLGAGIITQSSTSQSNPEDQTIFFDKDIFNQDIYLTLKGVDNTPSINYYIELEQVKLDLNESTVATLKDIRNAKIS